MFGRTASLLTRGSPIPSPDHSGSALAPAEPARAALLQAPRTSLKRDGASAGLPERAGRSDRPAPGARSQSSSPFAGISAAPGVPIQAAHTPAGTRPRAVNAAMGTSSKFSARPISGFLTTAVPSPAHNPAAHAMLIEKLGRPDLYALVTQLDAHLGAGNWAFTGSVALQIHGMDLTQSAGRAPGDADVEINQYKYDSFTTNVRDTPNAKGVPNALQSGFDAAGVRQEHYIFGGALKVDFLCLKSRLQEPGRRETVSGIPVLTLDTLNAHKEKYGDKATAEQDLKLIKELLALKPAAPAEPATAPPRFADDLPSMTLKF